MLRYLEISVIFFLFLTGCKNKQNADIKEDIRVENDIKFDSIEVDVEYYLLGDTANPNCSLQSKFIYPAEYKDIETLEKIKMQFVVDFFGEDYRGLQPGEAIERYKNAYLTEYKKLEREFSRDPAEKSAYWYNYYESTNNEIIFNELNLISYCVTLNCYTGGAHGSNGYNNRIIDLKSGNKLEEKDIFTDNFHDELTSIIVDELVRKFGLENAAQLEDSVPIFNVSEISPNNNLLVDNEGIIYTYNEYEIAPYSVGKIDVLLPFDKIEHLLNKKSPVYQFVKQ
ncbi:MAG: RsiV family protein [Tannerella sp.]|jgi:hypothetical protein|nr:RsiV family protein [Tannerella sp.]